MSGFISWNLAKTASMEPLWGWTPSIFEHERTLPTCPILQRDTSGYGPCSTTRLCCILCESPNYLYSVTAGQADWFPILNRAACMTWRLVLLVVMSRSYRRWSWLSLVVEQGLKLLQTKLAAEKRLDEANARIAQLETDVETLLRELNERREHEPNMLETRRKVSSGWWWFSWCKLEHILIDYLPR